MFPYVVETERRFYLANEVEARRASTDDGRTYFELELQRRVGLGHVPAGALRRRRARRDVQGRQHRGARRQGPLSRRGRRATPRRRSAGEDAVAAGTPTRGYDGARPQLALPRGRARPRRSRRDGVDRVLRGEDPHAATRSALPAEAVTPRKQRAAPDARRRAGSTRTTTARAASCASTSPRSCPTAAAAARRRRARSRVLIDAVALRCGARRRWRVARGASSRCASGGGPRARRAARRPRGPRRRGSRGRSPGSGTPSPPGTAACGARSPRRRAGVVGERHGDSAEQGPEHERERDQHAGDANRRSPRCCTRSRNGFMPTRPDARGRRRTRPAGRAEAPRHPHRPDAARRRSGSVRGDRRHADAVCPRGPGGAGSLPVRLARPTHQRVVRLPLGRARRAREQVRATGVGIHIEGCPVVGAPLQLHAPCIDRERRGFLTSRGPEQRRGPGGGARNAPIRPRRPRSGPDPGRSGW